MECKLLADSLSSLHFFRGEPKDGWLGNEHGPGSVARFCSPSCPNAYDSFFTWVRETERCIAPLVASGRCLVVYYEAMHEDLPRELHRIADFLGMPLSDAKRAALIDAVSPASMSEHITFRKGEVGDWRNHLDAETWKVVDEAITQNLASSELYAPLAKFGEF